MGCKATGSDLTSVIEGAHWLVAAVSRDPSVLVLNDILLNDCLSCLLSETLSECPLVDVSLGQVSIVSRYMLGSLGGTNSQFMYLVLPLVCLGIYPISRF